MDFRAQISYSSKLTQTAQSGYELVYTDASKNLKIIGNDNKTCLDIGIQDIKRISSYPYGTVVTLVLKDNTKHYISGFDMAVAQNLYQLRKQNKIKSRPVGLRIFIWLIAILSLLIFIADRLT